jgi:hypothetical protein
MTRFARALVLGTITSAMAFIMMMLGLYEGDSIVPKAISAIGWVLLWPAVELYRRDARGLMSTIAAITMWTAVWEVVLWFRSRTRREPNGDAA